MNHTNGKIKIDMNHTNGKIKIEIMTGTLLGDFCKATPNFC